MKSIEVKAYAKLNLCLDVLGTMPGGWHEMKMVMQSCSLCDDIRIELGGDDITVRTNLNFLPRDERNIAYRAAKRFFEAAGMPGAGALITLQKRIPVGAGLGGGSTDGAAVLRGLRDLTGAALSDAALEALGAELGSDVPFCVCGGTRLAVGRGDSFLRAPAMPDCGIVICKPRFSIRTPDLFAKIDARRSRIRPDTDGLMAAMAAGDLRGMAQRMYNVFEDVLPRNCGEIGVIKSALLDLGALGSVMSGTGSAVFGVFEDAAAAERAWTQLRGSYRECFTAQPVASLSATAD